jgi:hypothetical protein
MVASAKQTGLLKAGEQSAFGSGDCPRYELHFKDFLLKVGAMSGKVAAGIALVVLLLVGGYLLENRGHPRPSVTATLRITVTPGDQLDFVAGQASSAPFKFMISKEAGVPPALARNLEVKTVPDSSVLEVKVRVMSRDEGQRFAHGFVETLQNLCGKGVQLTLADQSVH